MKVSIDNTLLEIIEGDIADQDTDAVVTAAHWDLAGGQGTDGSIHYKAGRALLDHCKEIGGCPIGGAVITPGFNLKAPFVIHAVGPVYEDGDDYEQDLLACTYTNSLQLAVDTNLHSISFPAISTGAFCYPLELATPIAIKAILRFLTTQPHDLNLVRLVVYADETPLHMQYIVEYCKTFSRPTLQ